VAAPAIWRILAKVGAVVSGSGADFLGATEALVGVVFAVGEPVAKLGHGQALGLVESHVAQERRVVAVLLHNCNAEGKQLVVENRS
jgi:hypothetical protein